MWFLLNLFVSVMRPTSTRCSAQRKLAICRLIAAVTFMSYAAVRSRRAFGPEGRGLAYEGGGRRIYAVVAACTAWL
jgi:hypothetical protein